MLPMPTMFKLTDHEEGGSQRQVQCVNCGKTLSMGAYAMGAARLDKKCFFCGMTAEEYWKDRPHQDELVVGDDDMTENGDAG